MDDNDDVDSIVRNELTDDFCKSYITIAEEGTYMPERFINFVQDVENFKIRNSDIIVSTFPKAGTTWAQEMVWLIANDLDFKGAEINLKKRFPMLETSTLFDYEKMDKVLKFKGPEYINKSMEFIKQQASPRFIKTHLPYSLLPYELRIGLKSPKIIYVTRNPKDTCVSYFHYGQLLHSWHSTLEHFSRAFLADKVMYAPYWKHVFGYWDRKGTSNLLIITYEDMKRDLPSVIEKVAHFLDKKLNLSQTEILCKHLSFERMKNNPAINYEDLVEFRKKNNLRITDGAFIRSGIVGNYKEEMSIETIKKFDMWIKRNINYTSFGAEYDYNL